MLPKPMEDARKLPDAIGFGPCGVSMHLTPQITGSKKQSEERAALFTVRVHLLVRHFQKCNFRQGFLH
jgi:hypothetical protein